MTMDGSTFARLAAEAGRAKARFAATADDGGEASRAAWETWRRARVRLMIHVDEVLGAEAADEAERIAAETGRRLAQSSQAPSYSAVREREARVRDEQP